jgi:ABC-2 type transport system permease protein
METSTSSTSGPGPGPRRGAARLIGTELLKLRTMRVSYGLALAALAVTALFAALQAARAGDRVGPVSTAAGLGSVTTATGIALVFAAILGVLASTGEFRHGSATLTYLATPARGRVLAAKAFVAAVAGALCGLAAGVVATGVGLIFVAAKGDHVTLGAGALAGHILGAGLAAALFAAAGVGAGALIRSQLAGVIVVFAWCLVVETILGGTVQAVRPYLPYTAAATLGGTRLGSAAFGPGFSVSGQSPLPFIAAAALVAGLGMLLALVAGRTTLQRDIS